MGCSPSVLLEHIHRDSTANQEKNIKRTPPQCNKKGQSLFDNNTSHNRLSLHLLRLVVVVSGLSTRLPHTKLSQCDSDGVPGACWSCCAFRCRFLPSSGGDNRILSADLVHQRVQCSDATSFRAVICAM
ncbi:hypothetical protein TcasGA2_TC033869 [Tribolium castaneum]|uniref:Uncharacterized protein n=1 Tax=Tribolium castaneum TaxID=7070 RepID=A0A139WF35_TRICA|nr:hypothetical protein TcasGA2_TC033869 [Tribolium castaneum]